MSRQDGYAPIEDYAMLGDGRTVALLARDGDLDWWAVPDIDSVPLVGGLVDAPRGGRISLRPTARHAVRRRYLPGTLSVETTFTTDDGELRVVDSLTLGITERLPWSELVRRLVVVSGSVRVRWEVAPGTGFGTRSPWTTEHRGVPLVHAGSQHLSVNATGNLRPRRLHHCVTGDAELGEGDTATLAVAVGDSVPVPLVDPHDAAGRAERTARRWEEWSGQLRCGGDWDEALRRSALTLKALIYGPGGAIVAAPTTSLPEKRGGTKNWDYRHAWVRDAAFTMDALIRLGLHEEIHGAMTWLLRAVRTSDPQLAVMYTVAGAIADGESELDGPGWRGNGPVRLGNRAAHQRQLGTFGDLFDSVHMYVERGYVLDPETGRLLERFADWCCDSWGNVDSGMWELTEHRHYTASKMGCWAALDRAIRLAGDGHVPSRHVERWRAEKDEIRAWIETNCWSDELGSYTAHAGGPTLDAAVLLAGRLGYERGARLSASIDAVRGALGHGPLIYRTTGAEQEEGAFVACSFWTADALTRVGRLEEARTLIDEMLALANDVGLYSEMIDPADGSFLGNFPQGLSHLALIDAVFAYREAAGEP